MKQLSLGIFAGITAGIVCAGVLWFLIPVLLTALSVSSEKWLAWFPFATSIPALILGGFVAAQIAPMRKHSAGFLVGAATTLLATLLTHTTGKILVLAVILLIGGSLGFLGARLSSSGQTTN